MRAAFIQVHFRLDIFKEEKNMRIQDFPERGFICIKVGGGGFALLILSHFS